MKPLYLVHILCTNPEIIVIRIDSEEVEGLVAIGEGNCNGIIT